MNTTTTRAFSLIEIMIATTIIIILATALLTSLPDRLLETQLKAENIALDSLTADINRSFENSDFDSRNIAALTGQIPVSGTVTAFSISNSTAPSTTASNDWFAKLGRLRGLTPAVGSPPSRSAQPELARIVYNERDRPRTLYSDPVINSEYHRFILLSVVDDGTLVVPSPNAGPVSVKTSAFNALWDTNFETNIASLPAYWTSTLTAAQQTAWLDGPGDGSNLRRLVIRRITLPKHTITVNNNHTSENAYVSWTTDGSASADLTVVAGAGTVVSSPILEGRQITVKFGPSFASAVTRYQIVLRRDSTFTVE